MTTAIEICDLTIAFGGEAVLESFSLCVAPGEKAMLTGPSGSGKSTILRCVMGLNVPTSGRVFVEGIEVSGPSIWALRRRVAMLFQEPDLGGGRVGDVLLRPFSFRANVDLPHDRRDFLDLFDRFGLAAATWEKNLEDLSGGEKQRAALVLIALLQRPIVLLDEPASALDRESAAAVREYFRDTFAGSLLVAVHHPDRFDLGGRVVDIQGEGMT